MDEMEEYKNKINVDSWLNGRKDVVCQHHVLWYKPYSKGGNDV